TSAARAMAWVLPSSARAITALEQANNASEIGSTELLADLEWMSPHNPAARKVLLGMLSGQTSETAREAYRVVASLRWRTDVARTTWTKALSHADPEVRSLAINTLSKLSSEARPALAALRQQFMNENDYHRRAGILDALAAIDPDGPTLVPFLIKA